MERRSRAVASMSRIPSGSRELSGPTMRRALRFRGPSPQVHARCAGVDERILRMEESIAFHDVLPACHPADVDTGRGEPTAHIVFVAVDASDRTSVEEDADADAPTGGVPEDGCDPLAREGIDAHLDRPFGGREESEQGTVPGIRREDRREAARQLEFAEAERRLSQSMAA